MKNRANLNFIVLMGLFFGWGFVTCLNDLLTPIFKHIFTLTQFQANFVSFTFFLAYFIGALFYVLSAMFGIKFFIKLGYKGLIIFGLILSGIGCLIFIPAALYKSYPIFLVGLFAIGFGFTFLQISANPLVIISGGPNTGASRLNFAQGFVSLAMTLAPIVGVYVFYTLFDVNHNHHNLKYPYIVLALIFAFFAYLIYKLLVTHEEHHLSSGISRPYALNHANLLFGAIAIFFYVGSEVTIGSNLMTYLKSDLTLGFSDNVAGKLLAFYWGGAMIGRFLGGISLGVGERGVKKFFVMFALAVAITCIILWTARVPQVTIVYYLVYEIVAISLFMLISDNPRLNLLVFALVNMFNLSIAALLHNSEFAVWAVLSAGLFNSIMWANIFDLALADLGKYKEQGSSFLVMMILGGAILPIIQGHIADDLNIAISFLVPVVGYAYIFCYSLFYSKKKFNFIK